MLNEKIKKSAKYWCINKSDSVVEVVVVEKYETYCTVKAFPFTWNALYKDLFPTEEIAKTELNHRILERRERIAKEISSVEDLLNMMLNAMYAEEYTDYDKIHVARQKAKELLGLDLKNF